MPAAGRSHYRYPRRRRSRSRPCPPAFASRTSSSTLESRVSYTARRKLLVGAHLAGQIRHIEILAPALDQALLVELVDSDHLMGTRLAQNDRRVGPLLHHHGIARQHVDDVALVVGGEAHLSVDLLAQRAAPADDGAAGHPQS